MSGSKKWQCFFLALWLTACNFDPAVERPTGDASGAGDVTTADMNLRDQSSGDVYVRDEGVPDMPVQDTGTPQDLGERDLATPDMNEEDMPVADMAVPDMAVPDMAVPDMAVPDMAVPDMSGQSLCNGVPVDLMTDINNCGTCDNGCDRRNGDCIQGQCVCTQGDLACGDANVCVNSAFDPLNCGSCGNACGAGEFCVAGSCECRPGLMRCGGFCVDTNTDPSHCGQCNNFCGGDRCLDGACKNRNFCPVGTWTCDTAGSSGCVRGEDTDLHCDPKLLDGCGTQCAGNQYCYDPGILDAPRCVTLRPGVGCSSCPCADCRGGEACIQKSDLPGVAFCVSD